MKKITGYDIDGVLTAGIKPKKPYVIISGRTYREWRRTLKEIGTDAPIYLRPYGKGYDCSVSGFWKAEIIMRLGIKKFYEDQIEQAEVIKMYCPDCKIIMVTNKGQYEYK
jgi:hydroxymethylpyrimidine pyrophosphatase-like HAD family hydrolase